MKISNYQRVFIAFAIILQTGIAIAQGPSNPSIMRSDNLVRNGDFMARDPQQRPLEWVMGRGLQTATISSEQRHAVQKDDLSLKLADSSVVQSTFVRSEKRIANPGTNYVLHAWVKGGSGAPAILYLEFWDQNNKRIGVKEVSPSFSTSWQQISLELIAPDKVTHVTVAIGSREKETGVSYWDDIDLYYEYPYLSEIPKGKRELFLDDYRIESMVDVARVVHPGKKSRPFIVPTKPWEGTAVYIYGTVLYNQPKGSGYRMWYTAYSNATYYLCYATSKDGIVWEKPDLGVIDYKGSKKNNICRIGGGTLIYDPHTQDPERRYKLMDVVQADPLRKRPSGYGVFFSKDGFRWNAYEGNPVLTYADVSTVAYDEENRLFIASTKQRMLVSNTSVTPNKMDRAAFISISKDFVNWTAPEAPGSQWTLAVEGDPQADLVVMANGGMESQIYGMTLHPYEGQYIGLPWAFDVSGYNKGEYAAYGAGDVQAQIAFSRDLRHWSRPNRNPVLPLGRKGSWDDGAIYTSSKFLYTNNEIQLYYGGMNMDHGGSSKTQVQWAKIARASWRRDGFVSLSNGGDDVGEISTRPILVNGKKLNVNVKLPAGGSLKVEVLDVSGNPIPGFTLAEAKPVSGDQLNAVVVWAKGSDLSPLLNKEVMLRFYLKGGDFFSYWFSL